MSKQTTERTDSFEAVSKDGRTALIEVWTDFHHACTNTSTQKVEGHTHLKCEGKPVRKIGKGEYEIFGIIFTTKAT